MKDIDLSKSLSPEEVRILCASGKGWKDLSPEDYRRRCEANSKGVRRYWDNISRERYEYRCQVNNERWTAEETRKASKRSKDQWAGYSEQRRKEILGKVFFWLI